MRRDGEEPIGPVVPIDMPQLEFDALLAQHNRRALHPRAGLETHQKIFRHDTLAVVCATQAAISFLVSKLSSISTLLGSRRKICQRVLLGTWLTRCGTPLPLRCCLVAS